MSESVVIENDFDYLVIQWLGWDYNLWSVILVDAVSLILIFLIISVIGIIGIWRDWW